MVTDVVTRVVLQPSEIASYEAGFYYEVVDRTIYCYEFHPIPQAYLSADKTLTSTSTQNLAKLLLVVVPYLGGDRSSIVPVSEKQRGVSTKRTQQVQTRGGDL